jgi:hypothetical protein
MCLLRLKSGPNKIQWRGGRVESYTRPPLPRPLHEGAQQNERHNYITARYCIATPY